MVKRKSTPKKAPATPKKRTVQTKLYAIGTRNFKIFATTVKEIRRLQSSTQLCIPRLPFSRLIREILMEFDARGNYRIQVEALRALQEAAEYYLTNLFEDANRCAFHARRVTVGPKDIRLVLDIKGCSDPGFTYG